MSIILKGIDMPKEGEHILALIKSDGKCSYFEETALYRIMKTTEAIQIPKNHGRLIDEKKIDIPSTSVDMFENCRNCNLLDDEQVKEIIANAPTILEAEE